MEGGRGKRERERRFRSECRIKSGRRQTKKLLWRKEEKEEEENGTNLFCEKSLNELPQMLWRGGGNVSQLFHCGYAYVRSILYQISPVATACLRLGSASFEFSFSPTHSYVRSFLRSTIAGLEFTVGCWRLKPASTCQFDCTVAAKRSNSYRYVYTN